ncbi:hypothetical protein J8I87_11940 [Paraburkholderia sp. LEh10]|uniref:VOC family protein n=1 Tax=Paraburkholderia sp. LEh10 TaxID=2821353 RepID=UPI001AE7E882|nr:VOC family protein [Paraburkholderia sp. LEh10]MBP0590412.1 hypothetical protein [Paraburkholderia sp. LEh10]
MSQPQTEAYATVADQRPSTSDELALGPLQISEIILHTRSFDSMKAWYVDFFGGLKPAVDVAPNRGLKSIPDVTRLCFLRIHTNYPITQVLGLFEIPELGDRHPAGSGLNHMQFREQSLQHLFRRYEVLKSAGITPFKAYNHGPSTSFYYSDPDGNEVELNATNFSKEEDYLAFFQSDEYRKNVEGYQVDAESYMHEKRTSGAA